MQPDKWEQTKFQLKENFPSLEFIKTSLPEPQVGEVESAIFTGPMGKMKLNYITRPVILDKKMHGSRRIGSRAEVEYIYSDSEFSHQFKAYKWDDNLSDWQEIEMNRPFFG